MKEETYSPPKTVFKDSFAQRGHIEIANDILSLCRKPRRRTKVIYRCNLSYHQVMKYAPFLIEKGLLRTRLIEGHLHYETTEAGRIFVEDFAKLSKLIR